MSKYTRENPFQWKNNRYFRGDNGLVMAVIGHKTVETAIVPDGIAAFEAAERDDLARVAGYDDVEDLIAARFPREADEADQRITAWYAVTNHPALKRCFDTQGALLPTILRRLDGLAELERTMNELKPADDTWHWEVEGERARRGRWSVRDRGRKGKTSWALGHDDLPGSEWDERASGSGRRNAATAREVMADFLAWRDSQAPADLEPEFTPLPVPDVGTYVQATYSDGHVKTGEVEARWVFADCVGMQIAGGYGVILTNPRDTPELIDIAEWHEVERPKSPDLDAAFSDALDALNRLGSTLREAKS